MALFGALHCSILAAIPITAAAFAWLAAAAFFP